MKTQISYKGRDFIIEDMTEEEKETLKSEKPELYKRFIKDTVIKKEKKK